MDTQPYVDQPPYPIVPYEQWPQEKTGRNVTAHYTFGAHLLQYVRDNAVKQTLSEIAITPDHAKHAVDLALWTFMDFLDGYFRVMIDDKHRAEYVLSVRVRDVSQPSPGKDYPVVDTQELAPRGVENLVLGYAAWTESGYFGQDD